MDEEQFQNKARLGKNPLPLPVIGKNARVSREMVAAGHDFRADRMKAWSHTSVCPSVK